MKNLHLFLAISAVLQMVAHGAPITDGGVRHTQDDDVCKSDACAREAHNILKDLKKHMDPCIDFEQFVCGGFFERATTPGQTMMDDIMDEYTEKIARGLMDAKDPNTPKPTPGDDASRRNIERMHNYFTACMDETQHIKAGREPLKREMKERVFRLYSVPGSPVGPEKSLGDTIRDGITGQFLGNCQTTFINPREEHVNAPGYHELSTEIGYTLQIGVVTFINLIVDQNRYDQTLGRMSVIPGSVGLPTGAYDDPKKTQPYEQLIGEMFYILYNESDPVAGKDGSESLDVPPVWKEVAKNVVDFEKEFAEIINNAPQMGNKLVKVADLDQITPFLYWSGIFRFAYVDESLIPKEVMVDEEYLKKLSKFLSRAEPVKIQLFFVWSVIRKFGRFLDKAHRRNIDDYKQKSDVVQDDRDKFCYKKTLKAVPDIIGHYFVEATLPKPAREKLEEIINAILKSYSTSLQSQESQEWLESSAREGALKKLENLVHVIGYSFSEPDNRSPSSIDQFYKTYRDGYDVQDHFENQLRVNRFWAQVEFNKVAKKFDRMHMKDIPTTNNAYNRPYINGVYFPAGDLQSPLFNVEFPEYLNYGGFGANTGGHEITHTFDNHGITFDEIGRSGSDWFENSLERFKERAQCFIYQYGNFTILDSDGKELHLDGVRTLGENIADNGG
ncbi:hypothetical protein BGX34_006481, partial [Mortierella sp. NVP85]